jgi:hypothetical protein
LEDLAIYLEDSGPDRFSLSHHSVDRPLEGITIDYALDFREQAKLPRRSRVARLVSKPYV